MIMMKSEVIVLMLVISTVQCAGAEDYNPIPKGEGLLSRFERATVSLDQLLMSHRSHKTPTYHKFIPGSKSLPFTIPTLNDNVLSYPSTALPNGTSIAFHFFSNESGFLEAMWRSNTSLYDFVETFPVHLGVHCIFINNDTQAEVTAQLLQNIIVKTVMDTKWHQSKQKLFIEKMHFATTQLSKMGGWLPEIFPDWSCNGAGCGISQVTFESECFEINPLQLSRVDARYDWVFNHTWNPATSYVRHIVNECSPENYIKDSVNIVSTDTSNCSVANKIVFAQKAHAVGVLVQSEPGMALQDLTCSGDECSIMINIPVASIRFNTDLDKCLKSKAVVKASLQTIKSPNYYFGIDFKGNLVEAGWFLYPSLQFLAWHAQWLAYTKKLNSTLAGETNVTTNIFNNRKMQGKNGTGVATVIIKNLTNYENVYLEMSLSCPEQFDADCAPWDHVVSLYICCQGNFNCGNEIGRWISPFRRRVGHWLTDISMLSPLIGTWQNNATCNFTMKVDAWWAKPWVASLNLKFKTIINQNKLGLFGPTTIHSMFQGGIFDENYNKKYKPYNFTTVLNQTSEVFIYAVITGHGSDNNNCAEFCVTSHHFIVNGKKTYVRKFNKAGTPKGCADQVLKGVVPNEHGTWLYGRDGWCDGQNVEPWIINISEDIQPDSNNYVQYYAHYNGADPKPTKNPGNIMMSSYLVYVGY